MHKITTLKIIFTKYLYLLFFLKNTEYKINSYRIKLFAQLFKNFHIIQKFRLFNCVFIIF
jgi:hypothetical protein